MTDDDVFFSLSEFVSTCLCLEPISKDVLIVVVVFSLDEMGQAIMFYVCNNILYFGCVSRIGQIDWVSTSRHNRERRARLHERASN
jgi:hypothetical protein